MPPVELPPSQVRFRRMNPFSSAKPPNNHGSQATNRLRTRCSCVERGQLPRGTTLAATAVGWAQRAPFPVLPWQAAVRTRLPTQADGRGHCRLPLLDAPRFGQGRGIPRRMRYAVASAPGPDSEGTARRATPQRRRAARPSTAFRVHPVVPSTGRDPGRRGSAGRGSEPAPTGLLVAACPAGAGLLARVAEERRDAIESGDGCCNGYWSLWKMVRVEGPGPVESRVWGEVETWQLLLQASRGARFLAVIGGGDQFSSEKA